MTSPANGQSSQVPNRPSLTTTQPRGAATTPPDHRTTALQSAVAMLRGRNLAKTEDVLSMAEAFLSFLKTRP